MKVTADKIIELQKQTRKIKNVCIIAHVDHGKTTVADALISSNGLISQKLAGKLRYMDSREDEQVRGITMKSSAISLYYPTANQEHLINLIDSPGHIDFNGEVSSVVRLCDGAILLVDVLEGVCAQTKSVLRQAWLEGLKVVLVLNKLDRLITEVHLEPSEAELKLQHIVEQVNAYVAELVTYQVYARSYESKKRVADQNKDSFQLDDWCNGMVNLDDSQLYFSPEHGSVVFASAFHGWGFSLKQFSDLYSDKVGVEKKELLRGLWGDHYLDVKNKVVKTGAKAKGRKSLFEQLVLENIWKVYEAVVKNDKDLTEKIVSKLGLKVKLRQQNDHRTSLHSIMTQWLPLTPAILDMVVNFVPSPKDLSEERIHRFVCANGEESLPKETIELKEAFRSCDSTSPLIIFISKMVPFLNSELPTNKHRPLTMQEIAERREAMRQDMMKENACCETDKINNDDDDATINNNENNNEENNNNIGNNKNNNEEHAFIAFGRVFSGTIKEGDSVYVLSPKHNPTNVPHLIEKLSQSGSDEESTLKDFNIFKCTIPHLYLMMGRDLEPVQAVSAGNILGIGGLERHVLRTACLSSLLYTPSYSDVTAESSIVRVAVEPLRPGDMGVFLEGLRLLRQSDPCLEVEVEESGEHVLLASGEVHLNKCLDDLKQRFAKIEVCVSSPTVPFRETIVPPPLLDRVNEVVVAVKKEASKSVDLVTGEGWYLRVEALPLPEEIIQTLHQNSKILKEFSMKKSTYSSNIKNPIMLENLQRVKEELTKSLPTDSRQTGGGMDIWAGWVDRVWSIDLAYDCTNVLINNVGDYKRPSFFDVCMNQGLEAGLRSHDQSIINGFEMAVKAGPICEEPMYGLAFVIHQWHKVENPEEIANKKSIEEEEEMEEDTKEDKDNEIIFYKGILMAAMKICCRRSFQKQHQRIMWAMYSCGIHATKKILGKMYGVLSKRHGRVLSEEMLEGSELFEIVSVLPIIESFGFAEEFRKKTSGMATPQFKFDHWEVIDIDPFWVPTTEEEYLHYGEKADSQNVALKYMNAIRKRKGLKVMEKLVEFGDKQRTLTKNK